MFWLGAVVGGLGVGAVVAIAAILYIVVGGLGRAGEHQARWDELRRQFLGRGWEGAEARREARRQVAIKAEMARIEQRGR